MVFSGIGPPGLVQASLPDQSEQTGPNQVIKNSSYYLEYTLKSEKKSTAFDEALNMSLFVISHERDVLSEIDKKNKNSHSESIFYVKNLFLISFFLVEEYHFMIPIFDNFNFRNDLFV